MGSRLLSFMIEVDAEARPISGTLRPEGAEIPFVGWIGLARGLEQVLEPARAPTLSQATRSSEGTR